MTCGTKRRHAALILLCILLLMTGCERPLTASPDDDVSPITEPTATVTTVSETVTSTVDLTTSIAVSATTDTTSTTVTTTTTRNRLEDPAVQQALADIAARYDAVGLQAAVVDNGEVVGQYAYGWATKETDPMTTDHKIRIASVSKVIIGMAAMLATEDGVLDLNEDLGAYWHTTVRNPHYPDIPITMHHLLTHTSSITPLYGWDYSSRFDSVMERFGYHYNATKPGSMSGYIYNNYGFHIAGMTVELATGQHMDDYLHNRLFDAMDIDAAFHSGDIEATDLLVTRYERDGSLVHTVEEQQTVHADEQLGGNGTHFSGGLTISAVDLAKLCALLANDGMYQGVPLMSPDSVAMMETHEGRHWGDEIYQAVPLCYHTDVCGRNALYYHSGHAHGVRSMFSYDPDKKDGVVIIMTGADTTNNSYDFSELAYEMSNYLYELL